MGIFMLWTVRAMSVSGAQAGGKQWYLSGRTPTTEADET